MTTEEQKQKAEKAKKTLVRELATQIFMRNLGSVDLDPIAKSEGEVRQIELELRRKLEAISHSSISAAVMFYQTWKKRKVAIKTENI